MGEVTKEQGPVEGSELWARRARSFDERAHQYEAARPSYPESMVDEVLRFGNLEAGARAFEVGCGTGKASRLFLARGLRITAVEPGGPMLEIARAECTGAIEFHHSALEDWPLAAGSYDLIFAAQSFHWVDQETGYTKVGETLRRGGTLALFWNRPRIVESPMQTRISEVYAERAPDFVDITSPQGLPEKLEAIEDSIAYRIESAGLFQTPERHHFPWSDRLTTEHYIALLETYSAQATLPSAEREHLLGGLAEMIDAAGGEIDVHYDAVVHLARRA
jgi:SAM-dependent methyltransferase